MTWTTPYHRTQRRYMFHDTLRPQNLPKYREGDRLKDAVLALVTDIDDCVIRCDCGVRYFATYKTVRNRMNQGKTMACERCRNHG